MVHVFCTAKGAGVFQCNLRIQHLVSGPVAYDPPVIQDPEIGTFKLPVLIRADKYEFHERVTSRPNFPVMSRRFQNSIYENMPIKLIKYMRFSYRSNR